MFRFNDLVRAGEIVCEVKEKYPETAPVFERFGLRASCYECPIEFAARQVGAPLDDLLVEVNKVVYQHRGVTA